MPSRKKRRPVKRKPPSPPPRRRRRRPGALSALLVVAAAGAIGFAALSVGGTEAALVSERTVTVSRGVISTVVSGSGNLEPARQLDVNFEATGKLTKVYAKEGEHVGKGELLARLDDRSADVALGKAQADLADAEDALTSAQDAEASAATETAATATATDGATAQTSDPTAQTSGASAATRGVPLTRATTVSAQPSPAPSGTPAGSATPTPTATPRAEASPTATPSSGGDSPSGGDSTQSVASAQAAVEEATLALEEAEDALDATLLRAPIAGTVAAVTAGVGDTPGGESAFITLAQLSKLKLEVSLSESDIGKVEVGQWATVTVNAASGEDVAGHVTSVGVLATESETGSSGAVSYPVVITLDQTTDGLKSGMSATADIVVDRVTGLAVPSQALRGATVTVERDGSRSTQRVQTGVVGDSMTQVVSGLNEGDEVIVTSTSAIQGQNAAGGGNQQQQTPTGFPGGGLGGAAGGGGFRGGAGAGGGGFGPPGGP